MEESFNFKECLTYFDYSDLGIWEMFLRMNKVSMSLQGKLLSVFIVNDKIQAFR